MKFPDIVNENRLLGEKLRHKPDYIIAILANVTVYQLKDVLEYRLRRKGINASVVIGNFNNVLQDAELFRDVDAVIIFKEACNLVENFHYLCETMSENELSALAEQTMEEFKLLGKILNSTPLVLFNKFSAAAFDSSCISLLSLCNFTTYLNRLISSCVPDNFKLISKDPIFNKLSVNKACDWRFFYSSKALYTTEFFQEYANAVSPIILSSNGKSRRVLLLDCDNTLWQGILGEDGIDNIKIDAVFTEVQHLIKRLKKQGVLLGLCSRNNLEDVKDVFEQRHDMVLKYDDFVVKRINWSDKVSNIIEAGNILNLPLDAFVILDDSPFEIEMIHKMVPDVATIQVPHKKNHYPQTIRSLFDLFYQNRHDERVISLREQSYHHEAERIQYKKGFSNINDYLNSLELEVGIFQPSPDQLERAAQLTQRTNQFNLTNRRYFKHLLKDMLETDNWLLYAADVRDKFGDYGTTALALIEKTSPLSVRFDLFLMSCRIIGRNIEYAFINSLIRQLTEKGIKEMFAEYIPSARNIQVADFWDNAGFVSVNKTLEIITYRYSIHEQSPLATSVDIKIHVK